MRLLCFLARRFAWKAHSQTLPEADTDGLQGEALEAVVVWLHAQAEDESEPARRRAFKHTLKHIKWMANKRGLERVALHSFGHLGGESAQPSFARDFLRELSERLEATGYEVSCTPFGWFCSWELDVHGESLAKVWKEI